MRLDVFLKLSRLVSRRSLAREFCDKGSVKVNGLAAKASKEISEGDSVVISRRNRSTTVSIKKIPETKQISKTAAGELYELVEDVALDDGLPA